MCLPLPAFADCHRRSIFISSSAGSRAASGSRPAAHGNGSGAAFAEHAPHLNQLGESLELPGSEILVFEHSAAQAPGLLRHDDGPGSASAWRRDGQVERSGLTRFAPEIADDDLAGRDPDPHLDERRRSIVLGDDFERGPYRPLGAVFVRAG